MDNADAAQLIAYQQWQRYFELVRYHLLLEQQQGYGRQSSQPANQLLQLQYYNYYQNQVRFMTPAERAPWSGYSELASNKRERLGFEMPNSEVTISTAESSGVRKRKKAIKDPNAPKRATTAFFFFAQEERPKVRQVNPEFKVTDISKRLGEMWRQMDAKDKQRFQEMALVDRERYHAEMKIFNEKAEKEKGNGAQAEAAQGSEAAVREALESVD